MSDNSFRTKEEEVVNSYTHLLWSILSLTFLTIFLIDETMSWRLKVSSLFMLGLSSWTFFSSFLYHSTSDILKDRNREVDITSIYLMTTGCGVSMSLACLDHFLSAVAGISIILIGCSLTAIYAIKRNISEVFLVTSFILLGWLCILPITGIFGKTVYSASSSIWFIILGGLFYSTGLLFYARDSIKWNHTRWHIFVMLGYLMHVIAHYQVINY